MKVLVIGSGISGLSTSIELASKGINVIMVSPLPSERSQSVMAAGGINASLNSIGEDDSYLLHAKDTIKGGCFIENENTVNDFCKTAPDNIKWLADMGVIFTREDNGEIKLRALGGHSKKRTVFAGAATGKQIVSALIQKAREYEIKGLIERKLGLYFYQALIMDNKCYGALFWNEKDSKLETIYANYVVVASGGQNKIYGKTTGSELCDGYVTGKLFTQGVKLRNLEFIQYHPTSIETEHKRMLITEGARGEGGRLFYFDDDNNKVYFMEDKYGEKGNLMPRDVVSREIYNVKKQVYLDITFLGYKKIHKALEEVYQVCKDYINLNVSKEYIPVYTCIHFFMGGIKVNKNHETCINGLYAVGEAASKYHGANRLGGNSLMAAVYSGRVCASDIYNKKEQELDIPSFEELIEKESKYLNDLKSSKSLFPSVYIQRDLATLMNDDLGISRCEENLNRGLDSIEFNLSALKTIKFDPSISVYENYRLKYMMILAKATILSALNRKESRGAHFRSDYPNTSDEYKKVSVTSYNDGDIKIDLEDDE